jgi:hypothetical protein
MKRPFWLITIIAILVVGVIVGIQGRFVGNVKRDTSDTLLPREYVPTVEQQSGVGGVYKPDSVAKTVSIDFGNGKKITGTVQARTAFEALEIVAKDHQISIKTKQYQFGVMVESIGGQTNQNGLGWMYRVNGKAGQIAADRYNLTPKDQVEWLYGK